MGQRTPAAAHSAWCSAGHHPRESWRWAFFINVPVGIIVAACAPFFLAETPRQPGHFDLGGALTSVTGMAALVYAFIRAAAVGWSDPATLAALALAGVGLTAFVLTEARATQPVTPLRLFADGQRSASYASRLLLVGGMFGMFYFATQFLQVVLGFSPVRAGLAFLPLTILIFGVSRLAARLLGRFPPVPLAVAGIVPVIAGMAWLSRISPGTSYLPGVVGPMILFGTGIGLAFVPLTTTALAGVRPEDSGAASSMVNVTQQVGGALGLAVLVTVFGAASRGAALSGLASGHEVLVHGMAGRSRSPRSSTSVPPGDGRRRYARRARRMSCRCRSRAARQPDTSMGAPAVGDTPEVHHLGKRPPVCARPRQRAAAPDNTASPPPRRDGEAARPRAERGPGAPRRDQLAFAPDPGPPSGLPPRP
jgi:predicted MFS family arabinose efflux permease